MVDVIFDEHIFGALVTTTPEAMSYRKPVVASADLATWNKWHGSTSPLVNVRDPEEIFARMAGLRTQRYRKI